MSWRVWLAFGALSVIWGRALLLYTDRRAGGAAARCRLGPEHTRGVNPNACRMAARRARRRASSLGAGMGFAVAEFVVPFSAIAAGERWIGSAITGILIAGVPPHDCHPGAPLRGARTARPGVDSLGLVTGFLGVAALCGFRPVSGVQGWAGVGCMLLATGGVRGRSPHYPAPSVRNGCARPRSGKPDHCESRAAPARCAHLSIATAFGRESGLDRRTGCAVHGHCHATDVLPGGPCRRLPCFHHYVYQSGRGRRCSVRACSMSALEPADPSHSRSFWQVRGWRLTLPLPYRRSRRELGSSHSTQAVSSISHSSVARSDCWA